MMCVFGSFVLGDQRVLKKFGLGLAVAVLIDATIVRMVLVPATMELLGDANWWFPRWLELAAEDPHRGQAHRGRPPRPRSARTNSTSPAATDDRQPERVG